MANSNAVKLSEEENHVVIRLKENIVQVATNISEKAAKWKILQLLMISLILVAIWFLLYTDVFSLYETLCFMTQIEIYVPQTSAYKSLQNTISIYINLLIVACLISLLAPLTFLFVLDTFYLLERGKIFEKPLWILIWILIFRLLTKIFKFYSWIFLNNIPSLITIYHKFFV